MLISRVKIKISLINKKKISSNTKPNVAMWQVSQRVKTNSLLS